MSDDALSYVSGPSDVPLMFKTLGQALDDAAMQWGDREAAVFAQDNVRLTYRQLNHAANEYAAGFLNLGLAPGDRVGIWAPNRPDWVIAQFATAKAGLILVNINPAYRLRELRYALTQVGCRGLILADRFKTSDYVAMLRELAPEIDHCAPGALECKNLPDLKCVAVIGDEAPRGFLKFADIAARADDGARARLAEIALTLQPDDPINIQFTSGTTGSPKGATLTHHNILNNSFYSSQRQEFTADDRVCIPVPLYHCFGMVIGVLGCLTHGACAVFPSDAFDPGETLSAVAGERCTALYGVPTMFIAILDHPDFNDFDLSSLRTGVMAGATCPIEVMRRVISDLNMTQVTIAYGMTETSPISFQSTCDEPLEKRVGTVGRIHPFTEVMIIDDKRRCVPRGVQGELLTRGYLVMRGYWNDEARTREAIDEAGWMHTGDLATMDKDGYVSITGRSKDMIIRGGENIYPREIEEYLYQHPNIADVQVFGVADKKLGEAVAAWIKPKEGETLGADEIRKFCTGQIAHYKIPAYIKFVDDFPMTVTGKIQKFLMRDQMEKELGV